MTKQEKNIFLLENVLGYKKYIWDKLPDRNYPYWANGDVCFTLGDDFYPSPTDANYHINNAFNSCNIGQLLEWLGQRTNFMISSHDDNWLGIMNPYDDARPIYLKNKNQLDLVIDMVIEFLKRNKI